MERPNHHCTGVKGVKGDTYECVCACVLSVCVCVCVGVHEQFVCIIVTIPVNSL